MLHSLNSVFFRAYMRGTHVVCHLGVPGANLELRLWRQGVGARRGNARRRQQRARGASAWSGREVARGLLPRALVAASEAELVRHPLLQ